MFIEKEFEKIKSKPPREKNLEYRIKKHLKSLDKVFFYKSFGGGLQIKGLPDIVCSVNGYFVGIEVKRLKGKPQLSQVVCGCSILKSNGIYMIVDNYEEYLKYIDYIYSGNFKDFYESVGYNNIETFLTHVVNKYSLDISKL